MFRSTLSRGRSRLIPYVSSADLPTQPSVIPTADQIFWYDAAMAYSDAGATTLCSASGTDTCYILKDKSVAGNNLQQATSGNRPVWFTSAVNGRPALRFNGTNQYLSSVTNFAVSQPQTRYIVFKSITIPNAGYSVFDGAAGADTQELQSQTSGRLTMYSGGGVFIGNTADDDMGINTYALVTCVFNTASSLLRVNNTEVTGTLGGSAASGFNLGKIGGGPGFYTNIEVAEVIGYSVAHSAPERTQVIDALVAKYGL